MNLTQKMEYSITSYHMTIKNIVGNVQVNRRAFVRCDFRKNRS